MGSKQVLRPCQPNANAQHSDHPDRHLQLGIPEGIRLAPGSACHGHGMVRRTSGCRSLWDRS
jgi:hypothetical protein